MKMCTLNACLERDIEFILRSYDKNVIFSPLMCRKLIRYIIKSSFFHSSICCVYLCLISQPLTEIDSTLKKASNHIV